MTQIDHFEFIQKLLRNIETLRHRNSAFENTTSLQNIYNEGYQDGVDDALNELRKEL
jgi:hypothetical protein